MCQKRGSRGHLWAGGTIRPRPSSSVPTPFQACAPGVPVRCWLGGVCTGDLPASESGQSTLLVPAPSRGGLGAALQTQLLWNALEYSQGHVPPWMA